MINKIASLSVVAIALMLSACPGPSKEDRVEMLMNKATKLSAEINGGTLNEKAKEELAEVRKNLMALTDEELDAVEESMSLWEEVKKRGRFLASQNHDRETVGKMLEAEFGARTKALVEKLPAKFKPKAAAVN